MIDYAIKHPSRIWVERTVNYATFEDSIWLRFGGSDGSRLTVILSQAQANALMGLGSTDPAEMARDLYVSGHIEVDELERRLDRIGRSA